MVFSKWSSKSLVGYQFIDCFILRSEKNDVLTRLGAGDFFGEIGILNIDGANRRTADVRSVGYSELFSLSKEDVLEGCRDYPEAERKLYEYAQNRLGYERAKKEAADKMKSAFSTLTSIASCLTQSPVIPAATLSTIDERNEKTMNNNGLESDDEEIEQAPLCRTNRRTSSKTKTSTTDLQTFDCDNLQRSTTNFSLVQSLRVYSNDLMSDIEVLINEKMVDARTILVSDFVDYFC